MKSFVAIAIVGTIYNPVREKGAEMLHLYFLRDIRMMVSLMLLTIGLLFTSPIHVAQVQHMIAHAPKVDLKQVKCLAKNIFYEAGNEPFLGQVAVARVVVNRMNHGFARTPCGVVYQSTSVEKIVNNEPQQVKLCQFSWVCEDKTEPNKNNPKYKQAEQIAHDVLVHDSYKDAIPKSALFFHNLTVDPMWPYKQVAKIGNHIFYSKAKKQKTTTQNN